MKYLLIVISIIFFFGCSTANKAGQFGMSMMDIYVEVDKQAESVYEQLAEPDQKRLATAMTRAGDAIAVYNLAVLAWMATEQKPQDFDLIKNRMINLLVEIINMVKEFRNE